MKALLRRHSHIAILAALFVVLATVYSLVTPVFEASDEISHYPVAQYIATHGDLPIQQPGVETLWEQEGSQPPLYYAVSAGLTFWIDTSDLPAIRDRNPHAKLGVPSDPDNKNMILHTEAEDFPWRGTVLAVYLLRFFGVMLGTITVVLTYILARTVWPEALHLALLPASMVAFNPMFLFITGSVNNDNLIIPLSTWVLWLLVRILQNGLTVRRTLVLATGVALAALTKISGLTLLPVVGLTLLINGLQTKQWRKVFFAGAAICIAIVVIAGWWYIRNLQLYGEWTGISMMVRIAKGREISLGNLLANEWYGFWVSYWALFGAVNILAEPPVYWLYGLVSIGSLMGFTIWVTQQTQQKQWATLVVPGILILQVIVTLAGLIRWTLITYASQGKLMFPVIAVLSLFASQGLLILLPAQWRQLFTYGLVGLLAIVAVISPFRYIAATYEPPTTVTDVPESAVPVRAMFDGLELVAVEAPLSMVRQGERIPVTLYWRANSEMSINYSLFLHALGRNKEEIGKIDSYPGGGRLPTTRMRPGEIIADHYFIHVPNNSSIDTPSRIRIVVGVGIYSPDHYTIVLGKKADGTLFGNVVLDAGIIYPQNLSECGDKHPSNALNLGTLGGFARLWVEPDDRPVIQQGGQFPVSLYWDQISSTPANWTVFVHLVDRQGITVTQADSPPLNNDYPTDLWRLPCEVRDIHILTLPNDTLPGEYVIQIGFYLAADPMYPRATAITADGRPYPDNTIIVGTIRVEEK